MFGGGGGAAAAAASAGAPPLSESGGGGGPAGGARVGSGKTHLARKPSPPRPGDEGQENTFRHKLEEVKKSRSVGVVAGVEPVSRGGGPGVGVGDAGAVKERRVIINGKPALAMHGDWALMRSNSSGKLYFFNVKTSVNTWRRPKEWPSKLKAKPVVVSGNAGFAAAKQPPPNHHPQVSRVQLPLTTATAGAGLKGKVDFPEDVVLVGKSAATTPAVAAVAPQENGGAQNVGPNKFSMKIPAKNSAAVPALKVGKNQPIITQGGCEAFENQGDDEGPEAKRSRKIMRRPPENHEDHGGTIDASSQNPGFKPVQMSQGDGEEQQSPWKQSKRRSSSCRSSRSHSSSSRSRSNSRSRERSSRYGNRSRSRSSGHSGSGRSSGGSYSDLSRRSHSSSDRSRRSLSSRSRSRSPEVQEPSAAAEASSTGTVATVENVTDSVMAAKAKIESQMAEMLGVKLPPSKSQTSPPPQAVSPLGGPPSAVLLPPRQPPPPALTLLDTQNNVTWVSEYNFPAMLTRCKFPKAYDAIHEMQTNRSNTKRLSTLLPPLPIEMNDMAAALEFHKNMFVAELKNTNNRYRLLCEKLGLVVYKIPDELWDRYFLLFQVELKPRIKLEARPQGYTEDDKLVYTRTGKVAVRMPYPEDVVRCHAVMQAWSTNQCHCVYANKTYTIEKDDPQWEKDLAEAKQFLDDNGF